MQLLLLRMTQDLFVFNKIIGIQESDTADTQVFKLVCAVLLKLTLNG